MTEINLKLDFSDEELMKIEELKHKLNLGNNAEVVAYAVSLLLKLNESKERGDRIQFKYDKFHPSGSTATFEL